MQWQHEFVVAQIPELPDDADEDTKKAHAQKWVQADAIDQKIDSQIEFYNFCKSKI